MKLAQVEWDEGDLGRALALLEAHQPHAGEKDRRSFEWYYFRKLCDGDQKMTLRGHSQTVNCVAFSPESLERKGLVRLLLVPEGHASVVVGCGFAVVVLVLDLDFQGLPSCLGGTVTFSVGASGSEPLGYQWFFQNAALPNGTNAQLTLTNLQSSNAGTYVVTVSNLFGTETSAPVQLVVYDACIDLHMYAGLTISGQQGSRYVLSYNTDLGNTDGWVPLSTNVMGSSNWFYLDMDSPFSPHRFYKANLKP